MEIYSHGTEVTIKYKNPGKVGTVSPLEAADNRYQLL
jgi:hypothetical protein